jgi:hypothetical protein
VGNNVRVQVRKKIDALGSWDARKDTACVGFSTICIDNVGVSDKTEEGA